MKSSQGINAHIEWFKRNNENIDKRLEDGHITRNIWYQEKEKNEIKIKLLEWVIS